MKNNKALIITNIILLSCIVIGLLIFMVFGLNGKINFFSDRTRLIDTIKYEDTNINKVLVSVKSYDIKIEENDTNNIIVEIYGDKKAKENTEVSNTNGVLNINQKRSTMCFGFCYNTSIIIKLPKNYEGKFDIDTISGDITSKLDFKETENNISTTSGDILLPNIESGNIKSTSGEVTINSLKTGKVKSTSGDILISSLGNGEVISTSGEIEIEDFSGFGSIETTSGDIKLSHFEILGNTSISSTSGEIRIKLINEAYITADSVSGDKNIKSSRGEYDLKLKTISGDIDVR